MEFLKNIALPQSSDHIQLLHYLLVLVLFLFIPFIGTVFSGTALSLYFKRLGKRKNDGRYSKLSRYIIEVVTVNKSVGIILGIVPLLTATLIFAQLFQSVENAGLEYLGYSLLLVVLSLILIYSYRYSLSFNLILNSFPKDSSQDAEVKREMLQLSKGSKKLSDYAGIYGFFILFLSLWLFTAGVSASMFLNHWTPGNLIPALFNSLVIIRFIFLIVLSFSICGGAVLFKYFYLDNGKNNTDEYSLFIKSKLIRITFTTTLLLPILFFVNLIIVQGTSLSGSVFTYVIIGLFLLFLAYHFLYMIFARFSRKYTALLFFSLLFMILTLIISDEFVISNTSKVQSAILSDSYNKMIMKLKGEGGPEALSGEEIYKVRCGSCHRFDTKLVGPPHNEVVPKYFGKEDQLIAFIKNPVKVNPNYPPMPNPGLKPNEIKAVADYLLKKVKENIEK